MEIAVSLGWVKQVLGFMEIGKQRAKTKRRRRNASELNPTFGLDCVEERREVSNFRSEDLEWFKLGDKEFSLILG